MSYYLAVPFFMLGTSATSVTILWIIVGMIGCGLLASGSYANMVAGTVLLELAIILDCVDGHIARFTRPTRTGDILDMWGGELVLVSAILASGMALSSNSNAMFLASIGIQIDGLLFLYLGFFGAMTALAGWTVRLHWRNTLLKLSLGDYEQARFIRKSVATSIMNNLFHYSGALMMILIISSALHFLDLALILITLNYGAHLIAIMVRIIGKARSIDSGRLEKERGD